jgi:hypothetical protein
MRYKDILLRTPLEVPGAPGPSHLGTWDRTHVGIATTLPEGGKRIAQGVSPGTQRLQNRLSPAGANEHHR